MSNPCDYGICNPSLCTDECNDEASLPPSIDVGNEQCVEEELR